MLAMSRTRIYRSLLGVVVLAAAMSITIQAGRRATGPTAAATESQAVTAQSIDANLDVFRGPSARIAAAPPCDELMKKEILAEATKGAESVRVNCSLTLTRQELRRPITKRLIFDTSGVTMDCGGGTINGGPGTFNYAPGKTDGLLMVEIISTPTDPDPKTGLPRWVPTQRVAIRHCKIIGSVKVYGATGEPGETTGRADWVTRVRSHAPRYITFDDVTITGVRGSENLLYLFSGVGQFQLLNSWIRSEPGVSVDGVNVYLDSESFGNTFRNNRIEAQTLRRELMSLDASSSNTIVDNVFSALNHGGIYLYRNCGEGGTVRHSTPSHNQIINNVFYYDKYTGDDAAIHVAERNGTCCKNDCSKDKGYPFGSSVSDFDHAQFNVVMQNQIIKRSFVDMIKVGTPVVVGPGGPAPQIRRLFDINAPNFIDHNVTVATEIPRGAGCYLSDGYPNFIQDGQFTNVFHKPNGDPVCRGYRMTCHDGALSRSSDSACQVSEPRRPRTPGQVSQMDVECRATGSNNGCSKTVSLPPGAKMIGAKAACNLETGTVSSDDLDQVPAYILNVLRASDVVEQGTCILGNTIAHSGRAGVTGVDGRDRVTIGCRERDSNGGDCHIKGRLYYRQP
jgi:hypothetical protein